jgi:hypothetical protein
MIKYICVDELVQDIDLFDHAEVETKEVFHTTYDELHDAVFSQCPEPYQCTEPIALYHEVLWSMGLKQRDGRCVRDELHHALERWEYDKVVKDGGVLCVDIIRTLPDRRSPAHLAVL